TVGRARDSGGQVGRASLALMTSATGFMGGLKAALAQNAQAGFVAEFEAIQADMRFHQLAFVRRQARSRGMFVTLSAVAGAAVVLVGYDLLAVEPAVLITVVLVFTRMSGPVLTLYQAAQQFFFGLPAFEAVRALEADLEEVQVPPATSARPPPEGPLTLTAVRFLHPGGGGIAEASLTLPPGEFLGLTGASGAGKTTLLDLMVGLLPPQAGEITVGGAPLDDAGLAGWRDAVAYVAQDPFLFHDTVRRNLTWGDDRVDDAVLMRVLRDVGAEAMVSRLEQGLDTVVGERGARLSGGERQRLAIARALLRRPRLLVLDEATNAIDLPGEADLLARLAALDPRPAMVMIAHRPESLAHCDRVVVIEAGRIVEPTAPTTAG
ncbi:MAG TPA: ABC transporter ATP-binding protein, partial [Caulobacter sp.]|nr:ABC transporter ATP-binding protein [Caulobacter sp.]